MCVCLCVCVCVCVCVRVRVRARARARARVRVCCLLFTSDAADDHTRVYVVGRRRCITQKQGENSVVKTRRIV